MRLGTDRMNEVTTIRLPTEKMGARIDGPVGWIAFNNPSRRNAVSLEMWEAIPTILDRFEADPQVRVVVLHSAGEAAFVAGADISQFEQAWSSADGNAHYEAITDLASRRLAECSKPTIAMIHGWCIGGGVGIAACCDLRLAADNAKFGIPAVRLGVGYGYRGVRKLMDLVGPSFTKEIFFTARHFSADEARDMGLVNRVLPAAELEAYVRAYCATIANNAPMTIDALKRTVGELLKGAEGDLALSDKRVRACVESEDYIEGRRAFIEKRRPVFRGMWQAGTVPWQTIEPSSPAQSQAAPTGRVGRTRSVRLRRVPCGGYLCVRSPTEMRRLSARVTVFRPGGGSGASATSSKVFQGLSTAERKSRGTGLSCGCGAGAVTLATITPVSGRS